MQICVYPQGESLRSVVTTAFLVARVLRHEVRISLADNIFAKVRPSDDADLYFLTLTMVLAKAEKERNVVHGMSELQNGEGCEAVG
jgi:hypothetical protein